LSAILKDTPPALTDRRPDLPRELARVIRRCLEKDPERRLQTAIDLRNELEEIKTTTTVPASATGLPPAPGVHRRAEPASDSAALAAIVGRHRVLVAGVLGLVLVAGVAFGVWRWRSGVTAAARPIDSVAVLPFVNASGSADADYLSDGLAETLTNNLAQIRTLRVVPRTLAARYQGQTVDPREAGRSLRVRAIVTGRVVQRGDRFTIQAQLINAETIAQLWGEQFDRPMSDVLAVQTELSKTIAEKLRVRLTNEDEKSLTVGTRDPAAYELYLKGQHGFSKRNAAGLAQATEYYTQALARDPLYALAYVGLSRAYGTRAYMGYLPQDAAYPKAIAAGKKAIDLDERLATAHAALAPSLLQGEWNWAQSEREFQRALALDPDSADVHYLYGAFFLANLGRHDDAVAELTRAEILDPLGPAIPTRLGVVLINARRFDEAIEAFRKALALEPDFVQAHHYLAQAYRMKGMGDLAIAEGRRLIELGDVSGRALLAQSYAATGRKAEATVLLTELVKEATTSPGKSYGVAAVFAALRDNDQAFVWLERAYKERDGNLLSLVVALEFDGLRADPRFKDLVRRIGIPVSNA
jgi:TolB-like protein/tetratricopeptide (TPR) repeat protein